MSDELKKRKISKKRIVHVDVVISNTRRNRRFYDGLFGWKVDGDAEPGLVLSDGAEQTTDAPRFGITKTPAHLFENIAQNIILYFEVKDIGKIVDNLPEGGEVFVEKESHPAGGQYAVIKAPDGNLFGLYEQ
jgi:predicted enzyme related to lactoylglutathione lyase